MRVFSQSAGRQLGSFLFRIPHLNSDGAAASATRIELATSKVVARTQMWPAFDEGEGREATAAPLHVASTSVLLNQTGRPRKYQERTRSHSIAG